MERGNVERAKKVVSAQPENPEDADQKSQSGQQNFG